jgi:hypothetical protein
MSSLSSLGLGASVQQETTDSLGGGYQPLDSNIYKATLGVCYVGKSSGGATSITIAYKAGDKEHTETFYITNRKGEPFYTREGKQYPLPGYSKVNAILTLATGKGISEQTTSTRTIKKYNFDAGKQINTEVEALTDAIDTELALGIVQFKENKRKNVNGEYVDTADAKTGNEIDVAFNLQGFTFVEAKGGLDTPAFLPKWKDKHVGNIVDRYKPVAGASAAGTGAASTPAPATSAIDFG